MKRLLIALAVLFCAPVWAEGLSVEEAWVRMVPPVSPNTAGYLVLHNAGEQGRELVAVTSDVASAVEMHTVVEQDGATMMQQLHKIAVPADDCVLFEPGGNHIMFIGLKQPLQEGDSVTLTLEFNDGEALTVTLPVQRGQGESHQHHQHH